MRRKVVQEESVTTVDDHGIHQESPIHPTLASPDRQTTTADPTTMTPVSQSHTTQAMNVQSSSPDAHIPQHQLDEIEQRRRLVEQQLERELSDLSMRFQRGSYHHEDSLSGINSLQQQSLSDQRTTPDTKKKEIASSEVRHASTSPTSMVSKTISPRMSTSEPPENWNALEAMARLKSLYDVWK